MAGSTDSVCVSALLFGSVLCLHPNNIAVNANPTTSNIPLVFKIAFFIKKPPSQKYKKSGQLLPTPYLPCVKTICPLFYQNVFD